MTSEEFKALIAEVTAKKSDRLKMADKILSEPDLFEPLLKLIFEVDNKNSIKAAWVFEIICNRYLDLLAPNLNYFTSNLKSLHIDSAIRSVAKVCEFIAKAYFSKKDSIVKEALNQTHIDEIIESCFDWLIGPYRAAVKVYSMSAIYLLGKNSKWVHEELEHLLLKGMDKGNAAYFSRAKKIMARINKNK